MIEPQRVVPDNSTASSNANHNLNNTNINNIIKDPLDEEFSVKECAVKRSDSKKSTDDETSFTSCTSGSTSTEELTSGLSQDIKLPMTKALNPNVNNINKLDSSLADASFNDQTSWNPYPINYISDKTQQVINKTQQQLQQQQQQMQLLQQQHLMQQQLLQQQQQQNLQQLLQAQKIQSSLGSASGHSIGYNNNNINNSNNNNSNMVKQPQTCIAQVGSAPPQSQNQIHSVQQTPPQTVQYSAQAISSTEKPLTSNLCPKSSQSSSNQLMAEQIIQQSNNYYLNSSQSNLNLIQSNSRSALNKSMMPQQQQQQQQIQPKQSQPAQIIQQIPQQNQSIPKQLPPHQPIQSNPSSLFSSSQQNLSRPVHQPSILTKQISMDNSILKKTNSYYSLSEANSFKPSQSAGPIVQQETPTLSGSQLQASLSVPPHLPVQLNNTNISNKSAASFEQSTSNISKPRSEIARSFSEYKAYLDYLKNGTSNKKFESIQIDSTKVVTDKPVPKDLTIVRPYNPNENALTNNIANNNMNNSINNLSMPSVSNLSMKPSNVNLSSINNLSLLNASTANMKLSQPFSQGSFSHHSVQQMPNANALLKLNLNAVAAAANSFNGKQNSLIQPSFSSFGFNQNQFQNNQNFITNKNGFFPNVTHQRHFANSYPVQNNIHTGFFQGF